jgi:hypothetical protein
MKLLADLPTVEKLKPNVVERARRYAYHYFFRRMIPLSSIDPEGGFELKMRFKKLDELLPGHDLGLDVICAGIMDGKDFIFNPPQ